MLERLPFQPQSIPTLTMYERYTRAPVLRETGLHGAPRLSGIIYLAPVQRAETDGPLNAAPDLVGVIYLAPDDRSVNDGPVNSGPAMSACSVEDWRVTDGGDTRDTDGGDTRILA